MTAPSGSAQEALSYLKGLRPMGGWNVESKSGGVRLLRRRIPLTDSYFLDIHHDPASGCIVGILSKPKNGKSQGQVILEKDGGPIGIGKIQIIVCSNYDPNKKFTASSRTSSLTPRASPSAANPITTIPPLSDEDKKKLIQYALIALLAATILKILSQAAMMLSLLLVPCLYVYALQTCPLESSFDAKKELRRILRGHHLAENHPEKPKNWLDKTVARVSAAVTTELATGLGYEVTMMSIGGAAWFASAKVASSSMEFFWVGAFGQWIYVYGRKLEPN